MQNGPVAYASSARVKVELDHQPLEAIMKKPLNDAPKRLKHMLLQLQKYSLDITYKKGKHMHLADILSHAYLPDEITVAEVKELESINHTESLAVAPEDLERLQLAASKDAAMQELWRIIQEGWPTHKAKVPAAVRSYFEFQDQLDHTRWTLVQGPSTESGDDGQVPCHAHWDRRMCQACS